VLVIDNDPMHARLMQRYLDPHGLRVIAAHTGEDGGALARSRRPAAVVLDLRLPDLLGEDVLGRLKDMAETRAIPVVVVTAGSAPARAARLVRAGITRFLRKPIVLAELLATTGLCTASGEPEYG
jgi:DNA-binding response OmpR family regulator